MARSYDVAAAALALDVDTKWLDNVLSHHSVPGIARSRQGVSRAITPTGLLHLAIARALGEGASIPVAAAIDLASVLLQGQTGAVAETRVAQALTLRLDRAALAAELEARLADAVEQTPTRRRGRPPRRRRE
ncbi:MAG: hypothetical protein ACYC3Q_06345 [Gemmatimonadaceae bacterium]